LADIERKIIISIASEKDVFRLSKLAAKLFYQTYVGNISSDTLESYITEDFGMAQQLTELSNPNITTLLVEVENVLVGYAQLRLKQIPLAVDVDITTELGRIYIDKSCHGLGIGRKLISRLLVIAREMFHDKMWPGVCERNRSAW
jgi:diamine N-acetyltransferase